MWETIASIIGVIAAFIIGILGYRAKVVKILRATSKLLDELGDDAEAAADFLNNPTEENRQKLLKELEDDLQAIAEFITALKG